MQSVVYLLRAKSLGSTRPPAADPDYRLLGFTLTAARGDRSLGGNNIQAVVGAPSEHPKWRGPQDEDVALVLPSGWWVSLRNQFAAAPEVGGAILRSASADLGDFTSKLTDATGAEAELMTRRLFETTFRAIGPDFWR